MPVKTNDEGQRMFYLPRTLENWPWPRAINPHYKEIQPQSDAWLRGFKAFSDKSQHAFDMCDFGRAASLFYPWATKEQLRTGCDLINFFFVIDEYTDVEPAHVVREMVDIAIDALNNPDKPRPDGEILLGELTRQFWDRGRKTATPSAARHMVESLTAFLNSCVEQAADRDNGYHRTVEEYLKVRRENVGARSVYVPMELGMDFPDEVFYHPVIVELSMLITDMIIVDNDILSYNREQATGTDRHNLIAVVMDQFELDVDRAIDWAVAEYHEKSQKLFLDGLKRVPSWGPEIDKNMEVYLNSVASCPRGNECWSFESKRYFGDRGLEFQQSRWVPLLPKVLPEDPAAKAKRENVVIPLFFASDGTDEHTDQ